MGTDVKWTYICNLPQQKTIKMCRPYDEDTRAASRAASFHRNTGKDYSTGCSVCLGKNTDVQCLESFATCQNCLHSAHFECVGIPVTRNTTARTRVPNNFLWDCIYCLHLCECCFIDTGSYLQCSCCFKNVCKSCQGINFYFWFSKVKFGFILIL